MRGGDNYERTGQLGRADSGAGSGFDYNRACARFPIFAAGIDRGNAVAHLSMEPPSDPQWIMVATTLTRRCLINKYRRVLFLFPQIKNRLNRGGLILYQCRGGNFVARVHGHDFDSLGGPAESGDFAERCAERLAEFGDDH